MYTISIKMGLWMLAGFISFFILMYVLGFGQHIELHIFYLIIQIFCMYRAIRAYYALHPKSTHNNLLGVAQGMITSAIGIIGFALFMTIFLLFSPTLVKTMRIDSILGLGLNPYTASLIILTEGLMISLIGSYISTRVSEDEPLTKEDKLD
jgi:hypothetical protein